MGKFWTMVFLFATLLISGEKSCLAELTKPHQDSRELQYQDMLMLFLLPHMEQKLNEVYANKLTVHPDQYPYFIEVIHAERLNGFRGFDLLITLDATPTVGPHIPVGKDRFTFEVSPGLPGSVKLLRFKHLKDPDPKEFPPNYLDILKK